MFDFDMQYLVIWFILISALNICDGKQISLKASQFSAIAAAIPVLALGIWLGIGDFLYHQGNIDACLSVTPFHTDALVQSLNGESDPVILEEKGNKILKLNPNASIAYSAKANAAFSNGDIQSMIAYKEQAISCAKYSINEYCDYIDKLYIAYQLYMQANDTASAQYCLLKLSSIEQMIGNVQSSTDPLADMLADDSTLTLPEEYTELLQSLSK